MTKKERLIMLLAYGVVPAMALSTTSSASGLAFYTFLTFIITTAIATPLTAKVGKDARVTLAMIINITVVSAFTMIFQAFLPSLIEGNEIYFAITGIGVVALFAFNHEELTYGIAMRNTVSRVCLYECVIVAGAVIRELLGNGSFWSMQIGFLQNYRISIFSKPFGAFLVYGILLACADRMLNEEDVK